MASLTVFTFPTADGAEQLLGTLEGLQKQELITIMDAATVSWPADKKKAKTRQLHNVIGSCIYNLLAVLGVTAMLAQGGVPVPPAVLRFELPVMIGVIALCIPMFYLGMDVTRTEGAILFGFYLAITSVLILQGIHHPWATVAGIVVVVTGMTILAGFFMRAWSHRQGRKQQLQT
jgi:cation:H+ antiporter